MATIDAKDRPLRLTTPLGPQMLLVARLRAREGISEPFAYRLDLVGEIGTDVAFEKLLGQPATVTLRMGPGEDRYFSGIVSEVSEGDSDEDFTHFQVELTPAFALLTHRVRSRIFQQRSVPDVLKEVLTGLDTSFNLTRSYAARNYCVQYEESDYAFACRLMEDEGMHYYFRHKEDGHAMVISDDALTHPEVPELPPVPYDAKLQGPRRGAHVFRWEKRQRLTPGKWTLWDYNFELPDQHLEASEAPLETVSVGGVSHRMRGGYNRDFEVFEGTGGYARRFDGIGPDGIARSDELPKIFDEARRVARLRMEEGTARALAMSGWGDCAPFTPGFIFELTRHRRADGKYLLLSIEHEAEQSGFRSGEEGTFRYENRFTALPVAVAYRPPRLTPPPKIAGPQTATVVGPAGKETFLDKYGRVKVQFHWDRQAKKDASSSCWVRVAQIWAGNRWGAFFWPRIGQEVVVAFEEGDPDRPLVVGSVYNAKNMPPFELPANDVINGIKSCSVGAGANPITDFNGILFCDQDGQEHLEVHSERDETSNTETNKTMRVGKTLTKIVGSLPISAGSGSGGGQEEGIGSGMGGGATEVLRGFCAAIKSHLGRDLSFTVGETAYHTFGAASYYVVGQNHNVSINPGVFLGQFGGPAPLVAIQSGFGAIEGEVNLLVGSGANLHYGPGVSIHRGASIEHSGPPNAVASALAAIVGGVTIAANIAAAAKPDDVNPLLFDIIAKAIQGLAMAGLVGVESTLAWLEEAEIQALAAAHEVEESAEYMRLVGELIKDSLHDIPREIMGAMLNERIPEDMEIGEWHAEQARKMATRAGGAKVGPQDVVQVHEHGYFLAAQSVDLHASGATGDPLSRAPMKLSSKKFRLDAQRARLNGAKEFVINSREDISLECNNSHVRLAPKKVEVYAFSGDFGCDVKLDGKTVRLQTRASLTEESELTVRSSEIALKAAGGTAQAAACSLVMNKDGITLTAGSSSIAVTPDGVNIKGLNFEMISELFWKQTTAMLDQRIQGVVDNKASIINIQ